MLWGKGEHQTRMGAPSFLGLVLVVLWDEGDHQTRAGVARPTGWGTAAAVDHGAWASSANLFEQNSFNFSVCWLHNHQRSLAGFSPFFLQERLVALFFNSMSGGLAF